MTRSELTHTAATAALELLPDGVLVVYDGEVLLANRALARLTGEDLAGHPAPDWLPADGQGGEVQVHGRPRFVTVAPCSLGDEAGSVVTVRDTAAPSVLAHRASHDGLTGLLNQRAFRERLASEASGCSSRRAAEPDRRRPRPLQVRQRRARASRRGSGARRGRGADRGAARAVDTVGRIGGEEFAWLLPDDSAESALIAAQRLRSAINDTPFAGGLRITASIGVCDLSTARSPRTFEPSRRGAVLVEGLRPRRRARLVGADRRRIARGRAGGLDALAAVSEPAHGARVAELAVALAEGLGWDPGRQARLHQAARLHDLGKAALPDNLLSRPGPLSGPELEHVRQHARIGAGMAAGVLDDEQASWVRHHHERWDGAGYPVRWRRRHPRRRPAARARRRLGHDDQRPPVSRRAHADNALAEIDHCAGAHLRPDASALIRAALAWLSPAFSQGDPSGL